MESDIKPIVDTFVVQAIAATVWRGRRKDPMAAPLHRRGRGQAVIGGRTRGRDHR